MISCYWKKLGNVHWDRNKPGPAKPEDTDRRAMGEYDL